DRKHLFEAFSRADIRKNRSIEGTGLGLAIVKNILDCMGGTIDVVSRYGSGSVFTIELPVEAIGEEHVNADSVERPANTVSADEGGDFSAKDAAVLAVDDTSINLTLLTLLLKRVDVVPDLCESGLQAIQMCKEKKYDLILLDHMMPEIDGIETLKLIRESGDSLNKDTTAVVLTANAMAGSRALYIEAGFADYLTKPIDARLLEDALKKYLPAEKIVAF
ncbi:MAG: response regulator, partial [Lachnospiraceae bacterium]|nr:response regulator [Lachnospiraceae bacterium]